MQKERDDTALLSIVWMRYRTFVAPEGVEWPKVSVVIPAFNEASIVTRCLTETVAALESIGGAVRGAVVDDENVRRITAHLL